MAKINLDNVRGKTFTVLANKEVENGMVVGLGGLVAEEYNMYEQAAASDTNAYLVTTPEIDRTSKSSSIDHTNKNGSHMRVHQLEKGDIFTVEKSLHAAGAAGTNVGISADGQFTAEGTFATVIAETTIGADQREAIALRVL